MNIEQKQRLYNTLEQLGLSTLEITLYLEILQMGSVQASVIARRLNLNRSTTRYTLENLVKKKLIIQSKKNSTFYFTPENPEKIVLILKSEQAKLKNQEQQVQNIMGDLKSLQNPQLIMPKVQFFEGSEGVINMYRDVIIECEKSESHIYGFSKMHSEHVYPEIWNYLINEYIPARKKLGNKAYMIYDTSQKTSEYLMHDKAVNRTSLFVPQDDFSFETCFHIYGDKIAFYSRQNEKDLTGVIVRHQQIKTDHFNLFRMAWRYALTLESNQAHKDIKL